MRFLALETVALAFTTLVGWPTLAQSCNQFQGDFVNMSDTAKPVVQITQDGCQKITLKDNAGVAWVFYPNGQRTEVPPEIRKQLNSSLSDAYYSVNWIGLNQLHIRVHAKIDLTTDSAKPTISAEVEYEGVAYIYAPPNRQNEAKIQLEAHSIKLLSVGNQNIINGETSGFIQGANWVLDMTKHMLDTTLVRTQ